MTPGSYLGTSRNEAGDCLFFEDKERDTSIFKRTCEGERHTHLPIHEKSFGGVGRVSKKERKEKERGKRKCI